MTDLANEVRRERETETKVRAMDASDLVEWVHQLEDENERLRDQNERMRSSVVECSSRNAKDHDEIERLRKIIEDAPHDEECQSLLCDWSDNNSQLPCDCWKRDALSEEGK